MNTHQRNFLVEKIQEKTKKQLDELNKQNPAYPNLQEILFHAIMSNALQLRKPEEILDCLKQRALKSGDDGNRNSWLGHNQGEINKEVKFSSAEIFVLPQEYLDAMKEYREKEAEIQKQRIKILLQEENLILRIQLASDKTLQSLVNEIDDMGDITFIDDTLKILTNNTTSNQKSIS